MSSTSTNTTPVRITKQGNTLYNEQYRTIINERFITAIFPDSKTIVYDKDTLEPIRQFYISANKPLSVGISPKDPILTVTDGLDTLKTHFINGISSEGFNDSHRVNAIEVSAENSKLIVSSNKVILIHPTKDQTDVCETAANELIVSAKFYKEHFIVLTRCIVNGSRKHSLYTYAPSGDLLQYLPFPNDPQLDAGRDQNFSMKIKDDTVYILFSGGIYSCQLEAIAKEAVELPTFHAELPFNGAEVFDKSNFEILPEFWDISTNGRYLLITIDKTPNTGHLEEYDLIKRKSIYAAKLPNIANMVTYNANGWACIDHTGQILQYTTLPPKFYKSQATVLQQDLF